MTERAGPRSAEALVVVERLGLAPHPEGGWFRRTWTAPDATGARRGSGSSIVYLVEGGAGSRWHRIDASELWQHAAGAAVELSTWPGAGEVTSQALGPDVLGPEVPQLVVEPGVWQSARSTGEWSLVVCVVVPEFRDEGFELAPPDWEPPGRQPPR